MKNLLKATVLVLAIGLFTSCESEKVYIEGEEVIVTEYVEVVEYVTEQGAILDANLVGRFWRSTEEYVFNYDGTYKVYVDGNVWSSGEWRVLVNERVVILNNGRQEFPINYRFGNVRRLFLDGILYKRRLI